MQKRLAIMLGSMGVWIALSLCQIALAGEQSSRPNILLILADDLGVNDIGSWGDGVAQTPELDRLSQESVRFRRFFTDSTCSVSRAALLTGRAPVNIGFEPNGYGLSADLPTLPRSLKALGYQTHHIGKWHVGDAMEDRQVWPLQQGFDDWFGMFNHFVLQGPDATGEMIRRTPTYYNPWLQENNLAPKQYAGHLDDLLTDRAVSLIQNGKANQPWFINLWYLAPHHPFEPSAAFASKFADTPEGRYLALLNQLDHNVGRVLKALDDAGEAQNTIIVFASDNGSPNLARDSNAPLQGKKTSYLEGGVRTPLLIRWPGHQSSADYLDMVTLNDLYPTLISMVDGTSPESLDGVDVSAAVTHGERLTDRALFWAADVKDWGMTYGGHLPNKGIFYRDIFARFSTPAMTGPLNSMPSVGPWQTSFSEVQASNLIAEWERLHRPIPLKWNAKQGVLTGRDFQRSPVFGSYSIGLALRVKGFASATQTIVEQKGVWSLSLDANNQVHMIYGGKVLQGPALNLRHGCNTLVASFSLKQKSSFPFSTEASSLFALYLNGEQVMTSEDLLQRSTDPSVFRNPTYLGRSPSGKSPFHGEVRRPIVVGKFLQPEQAGYSLKDMQSALCHP